VPTAEVWAVRYSIGKTQGLAPYLSACDEYRQPATNGLTPMMLNRGAVTAQTLWQLEIGKINYYLISRHQNDQNHPDFLMTRSLAE